MQNVQRIPEDMLRRIESEHAFGITSGEILDVFASHGIKLSEATLRKYIQWGLLPRSVRVGRKGKHQGSQGLYPVRVVRQIQQIKGMMARDFTIEQIQKQCPFAQGDIDELERVLLRIIQPLKRAASGGTHDGLGAVWQNDVRSAEASAKSLVMALSKIERRLMKQAELSG